MTSLHYKESFHFIIYDILLSEFLYLLLVFRVSSNSVEQARERGYHRALLLSDHRKDAG